MANREELAIIRRARSGQAAAQLELGKLYVSGSAGLPRSLPTALHWLERAAHQQCAEAWQLIGAHIPFELARTSPRPLAAWYERAYDSGVPRAGLVLAQLVLSQDGAPGAAPARQAKALAALRAAAQSGMPEAQWLLAQRQNGRLAPASPVAAPADAGGWLRRAAGNGMCEAQFALLDAAWQEGQWGAFLQRALPLARALLEGAGGAVPALAPAELSLLSRCVRVLADDLVPHGVDADELQRLRQLAAAAGDRQAQLALGLWFARMRADGGRTAGGARAANFKKAIRWLTLAGEQGLAEGWYALSRIYIKPEFSQRNVSEAQRYLELAAGMGYRAAQFECGNNAWRARREQEGSDVRALYWLQKAAAQGCPQAQGALGRIAPRPAARACLETGELLPVSGLAASHPLLAARLELAALFGLTRAEALLLDVKGADRGHCLVIDIRASYGRSKRRLVALASARERQALDRIARLFDGVDCSPEGPEGNYRQRLYRLRRLTRAAKA